MSNGRAGPEVWGGEKGVGSVSPKPRFGVESGRAWGCSRDAGGSLSLRVQAKRQGSISARGALGWGMGRAQPRGEGSPPSTAASSGQPGKEHGGCSPALGQAHSRARGDTG